MKIIPSTCCHDCGGSCPLNIYVDSGRIVKIEAHDVGLPEMRPCFRGLLYHYRVYAPDRLKYPLKRVGDRGEGRFKRISWGEALDEVASGLARIRDTYGPASILNLSFSGSHGRLHQSAIIRRFLDMAAGGHTRLWGGCSYQGGYFASLATYGRLDTGNERADLLNSKMIILWGCNPAESIFGTETRWYLMRAKEKGIKIVCVDPRLTESAAAWASLWVPIRPGTDTAMLVAMAFVILERGLQNQSFIDRYTLGFDKFRDYVTGIEDGIAKTPEWGESITGVPADTIRTMAIEYATVKPAAIVAGWAPGRTARGEQYHRATATLAAMTGNVGIPGGSAACLDMSMSVLPTGEIKTPRDYGDIYSDLPQVTNAVEQGQPLHAYAVPGIRQHTADKVHPSKMWDAILSGKSGGYNSDIKMAYGMGGNAVNQLVNTNKAVAAMKKLEFVVVHDQFMTPTAKFADILLPATTWCERNDIKWPWFFGHYALYANKAIEPTNEARNDFDIFASLADRMGVAGYNDKTEDEWLRLFAAQYGITDYDAFKSEGFFKIQTPTPYVALRPQIVDPASNLFPTPSGKIEIFSSRLAELDRPELPAVPKYQEAWEGPDDASRSKYPLQMMTPHQKNRNHSQFHNIPWYRKVEEQRVWINPDDAGLRRINDRDRVKVFNDRGVITLPAKVTSRIMPGVVAVSQGAWFDPDSMGIDRGGCVNVLTRDEHSPGGAYCPNTNLVQIERM